MIQIRKDVLDNTSAKKRNLPNSGLGRVMNNNPLDRIAKTQSTIASGGAASAGKSQSSAYVPGAGISTAKQPVQQRTQPAQQTQAPRPYYTQDGKRSDAYIKDGVTYTDQNYTQRVPVGSMVYTADGRSYRMTPSGGVPSEQTLINDYRNNAGNYLDEYRLSRDAYDQKIDNDVQMALDRIYAQQAGIDRERENANRAAYGAYQQASSPYGASSQRLASIGLNNSGLSESGRIAAGAAYQNAISDNELARISAIEELNRQANEAMLTGQGQKAAAYAEYARNLANMGLQSEQYAGELSMNASNMAYGKERDSVDDAWREDETKYKRNQDAIGNAWTALGNGYYPTGASDLLGISQDQIDIHGKLTQSDINAALAQNAYSTLQANNAMEAARQAARKAATRAYGSENGSGNGSGNTETASFNMKPFVSSGKGPVNGTTASMMIAENQVVPHIDENGNITYIPGASDAELESRFPGSNVGRTGSRVYTDYFYDQLTKKNKK